MEDFNGRSFKRKSSSKKKSGSKRKSSKKSKGKKSSASKKAQVKKYVDNMKKKKHIEKIFFVTFPHKKNFNKTYNLNVSDVIESVVKDEKIVTHINFSKILF